MRFPHALIAVAILGGPGCFSTPGFSGPGSGNDAGNGPGSDGPFAVSVVDGTGTNTETVVLAPNMRLVFAKTLGKMPNSLRSKTSDSEWLSFTNRAYEETGIGVSFPDQRYIVGSQHAAIDGMASAFVVREAGPVRAVIDITWGGPAACAGETPPLSDNIATFAIYPDGRIVRHDDIVPTTIGGCGQTLGVYNSIDGRDRLFYKNFDGMIASLPQAVPASGRLPEHTEMSGFACLQDSDAAVGVSFTNPNDAAEWSFFESTRADSGDIGFDYMVNEGEALSPNHHYIADTITALRATTCDKLGSETLDPYAHPTSIIDADWSPSDGAYHPSMPSVTTTGPVPEGAVFVLASATVPQLKIDSEVLVKGTDYIEQPAQSGATKGAMFYLRRSLATGQELKIGVP